MSVDVRMSSRTNSSAQEVRKNHNHTLKLSECDLANRAEIEQAIADPFARIPTQFRNYFLQHQYAHQLPYLRQVNYMAQITFLLYFFADIFIIPDMFFWSGLSRVAMIIAALLVSFYLFKYKKDIRVLDMILPIGTVCSTAIWIGLLLASDSPMVSSYIYGAAIFILIANVCVQTQFKPALYCSGLISLLVFFAVSQLLSWQEALIFVVVSIPVWMISLHMSWNNTLNARRHFLRTLLDDWNMHTLKNLAHTDELTQLYNRRQFVQLAEHRIHEWPTPASTCLLMFDVDHFKHINDNYGHDVGDQVLQCIAETTRKEMRQKDVLARFGGEEFIVLLSETQIQDAMLIAERIRLTLQNQSLLNVANHPIQFTVSIGVSQLKSHKQNLTELIKQADIALYQAKENGRNRVERYDSSMKPERKSTKSWQSFTHKVKPKAEPNNESDSSWSIVYK